MKPADLFAVLMVIFMYAACGALAVCQYQRKEKERWIDVSHLFFREAARYRSQAQESDSSLSHLRNLNWLLARQIERQNGGEQLNPSKP
jgi:hypothetical protein